MELSKSNQKNTVSHKTRLSMSLFINYFIHGMVLVILTQNMISLANSWNTSIAVVSYVISGIGIGRLMAYPVTGILSDKLNRKMFIIIGMLCYFFFLALMPIASNLVLAYGLAILAGIGNSALDAGTYTTLVEINNGSGRATVFIKAFISAGDFLLPLAVFFLSSHKIWFGFSFMIPATIIFINFINILNIKFPKINNKIFQAEIKQSTLSKPRKTIATISLLGYGYTSMALMLVFTQWITLYGKEVLSFSNITAHFLLSLYSLGSITGVLVISFILKHKSLEKPLVVILNLMTLASLVGISMIDNPVIVEILCTLFGFSAAGGVMQTGLTIFMQLFPKHRGLVTGLFYFFGSIASLTIPLITGYLSIRGIGLAFNLNILIASISTILVIILMIAVGDERKHQNVTRTKTQ
ncbi:MFS transporter [Apilactobacillus timberlakei]|uniref:MFS transporter n=1 Tax=Apilactobacillus timberlakei TaxID=2008380 RepID=A0ABY2YX58_9LACO|nr:MFS transporter [Apilactobacillus timberlakei]TPR14313.1 MFS transporter [Apilactobacillus timberlakei]